MKAFDFFYYINGRFPTNNDLITALDGDIPDFIKIKLPGQKISPHRLYEMFRSKKSHVPVSTQFLSALDIFLEVIFKYQKMEWLNFAIIYPSRP